MASFMDFVEERDRQWYELLHARDRVRMFVTMELPERAHDGTGEDDDDPSIDYRADGEVPFGGLVRTVLRGIRAYVGDPERASIDGSSSSSPVPSCARSGNSIVTNIRTRSRACNNSYH